MMILAEKRKDMRVSKKCPNCGWRVLDKITPTTGVIELKCPKCEKPVKIDLSYRLARNNGALRFRLASSF